MTLISVEAAGPSAGGGLPLDVALSALVPLDGPSGHPPDANLLRRGILRILRENAPDHGRAEQIVAAFHDDPGEAGHPWAVSPPFRHAGRWLFRLTALGVATTDELAAVIAPGSRMVPDHWRIGPLADWRATAVDVDALAGHPARQGPWRLHVALMSATAVSGTRRGTYGLPSAAGLVDGWRRRWIAHLGTSHPVAEIIAPPAPRETDPFGDWVRDEVILAGGSLSLARCKLPHGRPQRIPVVAGLLVFELPRGWTFAHAALRALWRLSFFCGSGRHLTTGYGQTLPVDTGALPALRDQLTRPSLIGGRAIGALVACHRHTLPLGRTPAYSRGQR